MRHISNREISKILNEMAILYEMEDVPFKPRAYENVAQNIESLDREIADIYKQDGLSGLENIPGVGKGIAFHIERILKKGTFSEYEKYKKKIPVKLNELTGLSGLGPKHIKTLYKKLHIKNIKDLERAAKSGKIARIAGFGEKSQQNILKAIAFQKKNMGRFLLGFIEPLVCQIEEQLRKVPGVRQVTTAGSYRRRQETVGDIDILISVKNSGQVTNARGLATKMVMEAFTKMPDVSRVLAHGNTKSMVCLKNGIQADARVVSEESYGAALQYFTGSKDHNVETRKIAISKGLKLNEYGVFRGNLKIAGRTEEETYKALGIVWIPPEIRTASGEIEAARQTFLQQRKKLGGQARGLPNLIPYGSIRGDLQVQTNWTDGSASIEEMARAAATAGLEYIAITDHTKSLAMTGGLNEQDLLKQGKIIDKMNQESGIRNQGFRILKSAEVNILKDGKLDIADSALKKLDIVCVAVHSLFGLSEKEQTERIIQAMKNPLVNILFHPTGRLIQKRPPYAVDIDKIIRAAIQYGVALEVDAFPDRLDLKDMHIRRAVEIGAKLVIDSDAHSPSHFGFLNLGVAQARRGWATARDVLNTLPCEEFLEALRGLKK